MAAGIAKGEVVHVDASLIRADVSWESLAVHHVGAMSEANGDAPEDTEADLQVKHSKKTGRYKKVCVTDPDASMATSGRNRRLEPCYKQHGVVDDFCGVIVEVEVTTGEANEGDHILDSLDTAAAIMGEPIGVATADAGYA